MQQKHRHQPGGWLRVDVHTHPVAGRQHVLRLLLSSCGGKCAAQLSLSLEKLNFIKLRELHRVACDAEDAQLADFIGAP